MVFQVKLGSRSYPITFGPESLGQLAVEVRKRVAAGRRVVAITDANFAQQQPEVLAACTAGQSTLIMPPGETTKSLAEFGRVLDFMAAERVDRAGLLLAIGGGVIGDLAGFAAASYLRGIDFYQVPTTLLAMVDSSVGGKTGINLAAGKNLVGAFHQPLGVWIDRRLLRTLPRREFAAGMAEVIKYALLGDPELLARLERERLTVESKDLEEVVCRCCALKARIVEADEYERAAEGGRALLNLGHTFGHAIEQVSGYGHYLHGEAVAVGLAAAARLSRALGYLDEAAVKRVDALLQAHELPVHLRSALPWNTLWAAMARDKKVRAGSLRFIVMHSLGEAATQSEIPLAAVQESFCAVGAQS